MKTNETRALHPARGLALLTAASLLTLLAGAVWLAVGWRTTPVTLSDMAGDPAALHGFTVEGVVEDARIYQQFSLHDGYLDTEFYTDRVPDGRTLTQWSFNSTTLYYAVAPEAQAAAETNAEQSELLGILLRVSRAQELVAMMRITLPSGQYLQVPLTQFHAEEPVTVCAGAPGEELLYCSEDTISYDGTAAATYYSAGFLLSGSAFFVGEDAGICWAYDAFGRRPGLYRALDTQDGETVYTGAAAKCAGGTVGSLEPFYCPQDAAMALQGVSMENGGAALLYRNTEGELCVDLVNADGAATDHRVLGTAEGTFATGQQAEELVRNFMEGDIDEFYAPGGEISLMPRQSLTEAVVALREFKGEENDLKLVAFRAKDGKFSTTRLLHRTDAPPRLFGAVLNDSGDALLLMTGWPERGYNSAYQCNCQLEVVSFSQGATYRGVLDIGAQRDWASQDEYHQIILYGIPQDAGVLS